MRFRHVYMFLMSTLTLLAMIVVDPDQGFITQLPFAAGAIATIVSLFKATLYVGMLHLSRKALFDYIDFKQYFDEALKGNVGAGLGALAISLAMVAIAIIVAVVV